MTNKMYFLSFVEECVMDPAYFDYVGGRIEVYEIGSEEYAIEEIRFFTKKLKAFGNLRDKYDFEEVTAGELERLRKTIIALGEKKDV
ncbi:MAG: hypothetical protein NTV06_00570 [candidate division Zixibacteria bacterium]|nr:hypothetical protein [candidate division Zixibacteria bacterium]